MADDDLLEQARTLHQRAEAVRADADTLRQGLRTELNPAATELGLASDRAQRAKLTADHAVADADARVAQLEASTADMRKNIAAGEGAVAAATKKGDTAAAREEQENVDKAHDLVVQGEARIHAAKLEAAALREPAGVAERAAMEAKLAYDEKSNTGLAAEAQIDKIEQQADLIEQARMKLIEADLKYGGEPPLDADMDEWITRKAVLENEAEMLVQQAEAIKIDRAVIAKAVPSADDPPPPNDDLMNPYEGDAAEPSTDLTEGSDALGLDLLQPTPGQESADDSDTDGATDTGEPSDTTSELASTDGTPEPADAEPSGWNTTLDDTISGATETEWNSNDTTDDTFDDTLDDTFDDGSQDRTESDDADGFGADGF